MKIRELPPKAVEMTVEQAIQCPIDTWFRIYGFTTLYRIIKIPTEPFKALMSVQPGFVCEASDFSEETIFEQIKSGTRFEIIIH